MVAAACSMAPIKVFQVPAEIVAAEGAGIEGGDDLFNLLRNDVAQMKSAMAKDLAENALGEDVLDDHLLDGLDGNVGIERASAEGAEIFKRGDELPVGLALVFDELAKLAPICGTSSLNSSTAFSHLAMAGGANSRNSVRILTRSAGLGQVGLVKTLAILEKHGLSGCQNKMFSLG